MAHILKGEFELDVGFPWRASGWHWTLKELAGAIHLGRDSANRNVCKRVRWAYGRTDRFGNIARHVGRLNRADRCRFLCDC